MAAKPTDSTPIDALAEEMLNAFTRVAERQRSASLASRPLTQKALDAAASFAELDQRLAKPPVA